MKLTTVSITASKKGRSSHEERGLKYLKGGEYLIPNTSLLSRGAWIEIALLFVRWVLAPGRSSHEERGLKYRKVELINCSVECRSSHEERGLKWLTARRQLSLLRRSSHEERGLK